ncbi:MAG: hypothetical protein D3918_10740, partial [Candidatus Electrothrix sp. AX2]|nr:hypothetical protein [Candidatus Electrothrix gigas]
MSIQFFIPLRRVLSHLLPSFFLLVFPVLLHAQALNLAPDCSGATASPDSIWPPNHSFTGIDITGISDPDGDTVTVAVQCILQDEKTEGTGDGNFEPDASGIDTSTASIRNERSGKNDGRVYHIDFIATDSRGARCGGEVTVAVPHNKKKAAVDGGRLYPSVPSDNICGLHDINNPPIIYSTPIETGSTEQVYTYDADGHDPDKDTLVYSLMNAPAGMIIDAGSGVITWDNPTPNEHAVTVQVDDKNGGTAQQSYTVFINGPPEITSTPGAEVVAGELYRYQITAEDPNNDTLRYELTSGPAGMSVDSSNGLITWIPALEQIGSHQAAVSVHDGRGGIDTQTWTIEVLDPNHPPVITNAPPAYAGVGRLYQFTMTAEDPDGDSVSFSLSAAPAGMTIESDTGRINWTPAENQLGSHTLKVRVEDGRGGEDIEDFPVTVVFPPVVTLEAAPPIIGCEESVLLSWTSEHAERCTLSPGIGPVALNGEQRVRPAEDITYTITAEGPGGLTVDTVEITVLPCRTYTLDADFDQGTLDNLEHESVPDQLQLAEGASVLNFIWVANSSQGTVSKINTVTGEELGRYHTGPSSGTNPSRTTVDSQGNLWVGNRNAASAT